jgi:hypothetical protein
MGRTTMTDDYRSVPDGSAVPTKMAGLQPDPSTVRASQNRKSGERLEREAAARRALFAGSLIGFVVAFGLVAAGGKPAPATDAGVFGRIAPAVDASSGLAEKPITAFSGADVRDTGIRILAPEPRTRRPHVRTRAS